MPPGSPQGGSMTHVPPGSAGGLRQGKGLRPAATSFWVGFVVSLLVGQLLSLQWWTGGKSTPPTTHRTCHRRTKSGLCVGDVFGAIDEVYRDTWPGSVDLLIRSSVSGRFFLFSTLFDSIEHMWPKGVGDVVLVLDKGEEEALSLIPPWVKVHFEKNVLGLPRTLMQQWSYAWADQYTSADYVAITDDDVIFNIKVTPGLLFNLSSGLPFMIGSQRDQRHVWVPSTEFFVGKDKYSANFMVQLPFVVPRGAFAAYRGHVEKAQRKHGDYNSVFKWWSSHAPQHGMHHIQHSALGNFILHFMPHTVHTVLDWTSHVPIPRVTVHIPWTTMFLEASEYKSNYPRYSTLYVQVASKYSQEGLCASFPEGELPGCFEFTREQMQSIVWRYAFDWDDWPQLLYKRDGNGTVLYDKHIREMHCLYRGLVILANGGLVTLGSKNVAVARLKGCLQTPNAFLFKH